MGPRADHLARLDSTPTTPIARDLHNMVRAVAKRLPTKGIPFAEFNRALIGNEVMDGTVVALSESAGTARCVADMDFINVEYLMDVQASMVDGKVVIGFFGTKLPEPTADIEKIADHVWEFAKKQPNWPMG